MAGNECKLICDDTIYHYGDLVGCVIADSNEHARAAAAAVVVDLEPLPEYRNYLDAVAVGAQSIYEKSPTNIYMKQPVLKGEDTREVIDDSYCSVEGSFYAQHEPHLSVEGEVLQCYYDTDGNVVVHCKDAGTRLEPFGNRRRHRCAGRKPSPGHEPGGRCIWLGMSSGRPRNDRNLYAGSRSSCHLYINI